MIFKGDKILKFFKKNSGIFDCNDFMFYNVNSSMHWIFSFKF